jgi:hypothetical protein
MAASYNDGSILRADIDDGSGDNDEALDQAKR